MLVNYNENELFGDGINNQKWINFAKKYYNSHKNLTWQEAMKSAGKIYKKGTTRKPIKRKQYKKQRILTKEKYEDVNNGDDYVIYIMNKMINSYPNYIPLLLSKILQILVDNPIVLQRITYSMKEILILLTNNFFKILSYNMREQGIKQERIISEKQEDEQTKKKIIKIKKTINELDTLSEVLTSEKDKKVIEKKLNNMEKDIIKEIVKEENKEQQDRPSQYKTKQFLNLLDEIKSSKKKLRTTTKDDPSQLKPEKKIQPSNWGDFLKEVQKGTTLKHISPEKNVKKKDYDFLKDFIEKRRIELEGDDDEEESVFSEGDIGEHYGFN